MEKFTVAEIQRVINQLDFNAEQSRELALDALIEDKESFGEDVRVFSKMARYLETLIVELK